LIPFALILIISVFSLSLNIISGCDKWLSAGLNLCANILLQEAMPGVMKSWEQVRTVSNLVRRLLNYKRKRKSITEYVLKNKYISYL
jgi:hypothetical protein